MDMETVYLVEGVHAAKRPFHIPETWVTFNAFSPLVARETWRSNWGGCGTFYAAMPPEEVPDFHRCNHGRIAKVVWVSRAEIMDYERELVQRMVVVAGALAYAEIVHRFLQEGESWSSS